MADATVTTERRKELRKRPLGLVYVELSSVNGGMLRDLSESGFAMRAMIPLRLGESMPFSFSLNPGTRLSGECKVSWVEEDGRVAGLEFTSVPKELRVAVRSWLREDSFAVPSPSLPASPPVKEAPTLKDLRDELRSISPNVRAPEREEPTTDLGQPKTEIKSEPIQKKTSGVGSMMTAGTKPPESEEPVALTYVEDVIPLPELEPLPTVLDTEGIPDLVRVNRGYARSGISMAIRMMIALALVAGAVVYRRPLGDAIIWLGQKIAGSTTQQISFTPNRDEPQSPPTAVPSTPAEVSPNSPSIVPDASSPTPTGNATPDSNTPPTASKKSAEVPPNRENAVPQPVKSSSRGAGTTPVPVPTTNRTTVYSAPSNPPPDQAGQQEYLSAQDILKNKGSNEANLPEAVRLLWVAVEKGNSSAEISLAELYRAGQGVAKSCDQTRILLTAAAKKGNAEAQKHLDQFLKEGCE